MDCTVCTACNLALFFQGRAAFGIHKIRVTAFSAGATREMMFHNIVSLPIIQGVSRRQGPIV